MGHKSPFLSRKRMIAVPDLQHKDQTCSGSTIGILAATPFVKTMDLNQRFRLLLRCKHLDIPAVIALQWIP